MQRHEPRHDQEVDPAPARRLADRLDRLSVPLAENVIRRAIDLHHDEQFGSAREGIDVDTVEKIAAELGMGPDLVRRALLEELQTEHDDADGLGDRLLGPSRVTGGVVTRADAEELDARVDEWMRRHEGLRARARSGRAVRWERDSGIGTAIRRGLKRTQGTGALRASPSVVTRQTEVAADQHLVEIEADTSNVKTESAGIGIAAGVGAVAVGAAVAAAGTFAPDAVEFLTGFLPGIGAALLAAGAYARARISRTKAGINRAIDGILHPGVTARNEDRRRRGRSRRPSWIQIVEDVVDEIFE